MTRAPDSVQPVLIGPKNCREMIGTDWRWLRDHAGELGIEIRRVRGKPFAIAGDVLAAVRRYGQLVAGSAPANDDERDDEPALGELRTRLGMRRSGGGGRP